MQAKYTDFLARDDTMGQPIFSLDIFYHETSVRGSIFEGRCGINWKQNGGSEFAGFFIRLELWKWTYAKDCIDKSNDLISFYEHFLCSPV